jgi:predicted nucleotide-binding protein (sugar kinase/HSP70/actin superfamily)
MNSRIKQAQKEGASLGDISAGLSVSVVKNAIQKVMKIRDINTLGDNIVVQGGTFYNDAVLRAFEQTIGKSVIRPDIAGLMGAYGACLLAISKYKENGKNTSISTIFDETKLNNIEVKTTHARCKRCENNCLLTSNQFNGKKSFISGNRCEIGSGISQTSNKLPNLYKYQYDKVFNYTPLNEKEAARGVIGIPRVLNMYEDYPFWFTFFTSLGFRVIISEKSTRKTYEKGMESMPSESVCYPAKLTHGHITDLMEKGTPTIFYPAMPYARKEVKEAENNYNCPIVISYSEVIKNNVESLNKVTFINEFLPFEIKKLAKRILETEEFSKYNFSKEELYEAGRKAEEEHNKVKADIRKKGEETLKYINENNLRGIVLGGRPYHLDPEVNHGIDTLITSLGLAVLTEDAIAHLGTLEYPLRVVDQWTYHSRLYRAAEVVGNSPNLELVQLNSFGCGVDAVTTDQVEEILSNYDKMYTLIKIDEINNLGAVRIRIRSLIASMNRKCKEDSTFLNQSNVGGDAISTQTAKHLTKKPYKFKKNIFTKEMKEAGYTILVPQMAPVHFEIMVEAMKMSRIQFRIAGTLHRKNSRYRT